MVRLYCLQNLVQGITVALASSQAQYLHKVMRKKVGDAILLFNDSDGLYCCQIIDCSKSSAAVHVLQLLQPASKMVPLYLACCPTKHGGFSQAVEKATELGVTEIIPVITERTIVRCLNHHKLVATAIDATEQSERFSPPRIHQEITLRKFLASKPFAGNLLFCKERAAVTNALPITGDGHCILVGPEGGFTADEVALLESYPFTISIGLGNRILRAETAIVAALSFYQTLYGKWQ